MTAATSVATAQPTDVFSYAWEHPRLIFVQMMDDTDVHDELYFEKEYLLSRCESPFPVAAPALFVEDSLSGEGMAFFRQAPLPHARSDASADWRIVPADGRVEVLSNAYRCVRIPYSGGNPGRIRAATDFHRMFRPYVAGRDGLFLSNTWGDGNRDACINEDFIMREVEAGASLGVDVIQIDDGWQKGRSANSAALAKGENGRWGDWWNVDGFWDVDPVRFPNGLEPVVAAARAKGMSTLARIAAARFFPSVPEAHSMSHAAYCPLRVRRSQASRRPRSACRVPAKMVAAAARRRSIEFAGRTLARRQLAVRATTIPATHDKLANAASGDAGSSHHGNFSASWRNGAAFCL